MQLEAIDFNTNRILAYLRSDDSTSIAVISNLGSKTEVLELPFKAELLRNNKANQLEGMTLTLEPYGSVYLIVQ